MKVLDALASDAPAIAASCHDGNTAMLLAAAAQHILKRRDFGCAVYMLFPPAEEGGAGAREMTKDGVLDRFAMEAVFGMHSPSYDFSCDLIPLGGTYWVQLANRWLNTPIGA